MGLLDVSFNDFLQKHDFDHFNLILHKRLSCEILFSHFVYLLLDRITYIITIVYVIYILNLELISVKLSFQTWRFQDTK